MTTRLGLALRVLFCPRTLTPCADCGGEGYYYMLRDSLWLLVNRGSTEGFLCLRCVEKRLGRPLVRDDFTDVPINSAILYLFERFDR